MSALPARSVPPSTAPTHGLSRLVVVTDPELGEVPVRWRGPGHAWAWRCAACHLRTSTTDCMHIFSAALFLAEELLGLTRIPEYDPTPTGDER